MLDVLNGKNGRQNLLENLLQQGHLLACCAINVAEVYAGLRDKEEARTRAFLESLEYLDVTWDMARQAGLLKRDFAQKGVALTATDCLIAAVVLTSGCTLLTDNVKDFPMKGLILYPLT